MEFSHIVPHDVDLDSEEANEVGSDSPDPPVWADVRSPFYPPIKRYAGIIVDVPLGSCVIFTYFSG